MKVYKIQSSNGELQYSPIDTKEEQIGFLSAILLLSKGQKLEIEVIDMPEDEFKNDLLTAAWPDLSKE